MSDVIVINAQTRSPDRPSLQYSSGGSGILIKKNEAFCLPAGGGGGQYIIEPEEKNFMNKNIEPKKSLGKKIKMCSMFTGIGGFEKGAIDAGLDIEVVGYSEINKYAISIYKKHFPESKNYGSATDIIPEQLPDFDLLVGGVPCQTWSIAGKRKGFEDSRGTMWYEYFRVLKSKQPKYFIAENVAGILSHNKGKSFEQICEAFCELGYVIDFDILNSKFFGVPQNRQRVFIIGIRQDLLDPIQIF